MDRKPAIIYQVSTVDAGQFNVTLDDDDPKNCWKWLTLFHVHEAFAMLALKALDATCNTSRKKLLFLEM